MANIPSPIVTGGGGGRSNPLEAIMVGLAQSAPSILMQMLDRNAAGNAADMQGQADLATMLGMLQSGQISDPSVVAGFQAAGGQFTPPQQMAPTVQVGGNKPVAGPMSQRQVAAGNISPRQATPLLQSLLGGQQAVSNIEQSRAATAASGAQTAATTQATAQSAKLFPIQMQQAEAGVELTREQTSETRASASRQRTLEQLDAEQLSFNQATRADRERTAALEALGAQEKLTAARVENRTRAARWAQDDVQTLASVTASLAQTFPGTSPEALRALAAQQIYGVAKAPTVGELTSYYQQYNGEGEVQTMADMLRASIVSLYGDVLGSDPRVDPVAKYNQLRDVVRAEGADRAIQMAFQRGAPTVELEVLAAIGTTEELRPIDVAKIIGTPLPNFGSRIGQAVGGLRAPERLSGAVSKGMPFGPAGVGISILEEFFARDFRRGYSQARQARQQQPAAR